MQIELILHHPFIGTKYFKNHHFNEPQGFFEDEYILGFIKGLENGLFSSLPNISLRKQADTSILFWELIRKNKEDGMRSYLKIADLTLSQNRQSPFFEGLDGGLKASMISMDFKLNNKNDQLYIKATQLLQEIAPKETPNNESISTAILTLTYLKHVADNYLSAPEHDDYWEELAQNIQTSQNESNLKELRYYLRKMGYDLTDEGARISALSIVSDYNSVETASHIAHTTLALDIQSAGDDINKLTKFIPHGMAIIDLLKSYAEQGKIKPEIYRNDTTAIMGVITIDANQMDWIERILSQPNIGKTRLAKSIVEYRQ